jgi:nicotinamide mononucleotide transporter
MIGPLEIAANLFTAVAIVLAGRNNVHTWWTGIVGCALFAILFWQGHLYADVVLQTFFVATGIAGWRKWLHGGNTGAELPVTHARPSTLAWSLVAGVLLTAGYGALLHHYTDAYAPFVDSAVLVFSVIGQILMMQRRVENWAFWLLVNTIAVPLYFSRGLHLTALLYAGFWINALVAWRSWRRLAAAPQRDPAAVPFSVSIESTHQ